MKSKLGRKKVTKGTKPASPLPPPPVRPEDDVCHYRIGCPCRRCAYDRGEA